MIGQMGIIATLQDAGVLDNVEQWYGSSGGSILAISCALGVSPGWIRDLSQSMRFKQFLEIDSDNLVDFWNRWGLNDGAALVQYIGRIFDTWAPGSSGWTFTDLVQRTGKSLYINATNVNKGCNVIFSADTSPDLPILDAMRASISIPFFFTPWRHPATGEFYCDGGVTEFYPWQTVGDKENTLVISTQAKGLQKHPTSAKIQHLNEYMRYVYNATNTMITPHPKNWISLNQKRYVSIDFGISLEEQHELFAMGEAAGKGWLAWRSTVAEAKKTMRLRCDPHHTVTSVPPSSKQMSEIPCMAAPEHPRQIHQSDPQFLRPSRRWSL